MLSDDELRAHIEVGVELRNLEFKGPGSTSSAEFVAVVARACIALANQRDGGHLVIGVVDDDPAGERSGLDAVQLEEWLDYDTVTAKVNTYADPPLQLKIAARRLSSGQPVVVVEVAEFSELPILSAKEFSGKIVRGQLYTRSMAKPESSASNTHNELRELLSVAAEKQLQIFLRTARRAGLSVEAAGGSGHAERFGAERAAFAREPLSGRVASGPQIRVSARPYTYSADRLGYETLRELAADNAVRFDGWPFPFVHHVEFGDHWVGEAQTDLHPEVWGLHQSGQFLARRPLPVGFGPDWDAISDPEADEVLYVPVWFLVRFVLEAVVFTARLQRAAMPEEPMVLDFAVEGAQGSQLVVADSRRSSFHHTYKMGAARWERCITLSPDLIEEDLKRLAAETSRDLLLRFGWMGVTTEIIRGMQEEVIR